MTKLTVMQEFILTPQAVALYNRLRRTKSISAREAMLDYGMTSATLARRIVDLEVVGVKIERERRTHPETGARYTRYKLLGNDLGTTLQSRTRERMRQATRADTGGSRGNI